MDIRMGRPASSDHLAPRTKELQLLPNLPGETPSRFGRGLDTLLIRPYSWGIGSGRRCAVPGVSRRHQNEPEEKKVALLEFIAASAILLITALVLYMVFSYQPV
jgi:hypothetical protein